MVVHNCNLISLEAEVVRLRDRGHHGLHNVTLYKIQRHQGTLSALCASQMHNKSLVVLWQSDPGCGFPVNTEVDSIAGWSSALFGLVPGWHIRTAWAVRGPCGSTK